LQLANYVSRFGQTIHLQNRLEVIARRMGMAANLTFGEDRDKHINNYIVYCMAQMFGRHVDKHAAAAGLLKPKIEVIEEIIRDEKANESDEFESDSDDEKVRLFHCDNLCFVVSTH
jgi:3-methyladenine DNA glycosylase AlkD